MADAAGETLGGVGYVERGEFDNPLGRISEEDSTPTFVDLDGDRDLVLGSFAGTLLVYDNSNADTGFTELTGSANPFNGIDEGYRSAPVLADVDGDLDLVVGANNGAVRLFDNNDADGGYTELTEANNPFLAVGELSHATPTFADVDGDGDLDLVVGFSNGTFAVYENTAPHGQVTTVVVTPEAETISGTTADDNITVLIFTQK